MAEETQEFTAPQATELSDHALMIAYSKLPRLDEVMDHMLSVASRYGHDAAATLKAAITSATKGATGVRVFNVLGGVPAFFPQTATGREALETVWAPADQAVDADENQAIGGLLWSLPNGGWQYVHLMATGSVSSEVMGLPQAPHEELSAARYTDDTDLLYLSREFVRVGVGIADQLRHAADKIERHARNVRPDLTDLKLDHNYAVSEILHDINTMHGNLNTSGLLRAAADADRHARGGTE